MAQPLRRCRVCRAVRPKAELTRWVMQGGQPVKDPQQKIQARGFYTDSLACEERLQKQPEKSHRR